MSEWSDLSNTFMNCQDKGPQILMAMILLSVSTVAAVARINVNPKHPKSKEKKKVYSPGDNKRQIFKLIKRF